MGNATQIAKGGNVPSEWGWGEIRKDFFSILTLRIAARKEKKYYQETDGDKRIMPLSEWCWSRKRQIGPNECLERIFAVCQS